MNGYATLADLVLTEAGEVYVVAKDRYNYLSNFAWVSKEFANELLEMDNFKVSIIDAKNRLLRSNFEWVN